MENNPELLKHIYHEDLYIIDEPEIEQPQDQPAAAPAKELPEENPSVAEEQQPVKYLGRNEKGILVLVNDPGSELLNQTDLDFFMKVVESGLRYSKNDFALVNADRFLVSQVLEEVPYSYILSFGVSIPLEDSSAEKYEVIDLQSHHVLLADPLREISADQSKKRMLWSSLKAMFNIT